MIARHITTSFPDGPKDQTSGAQCASGNLEIPGSRFARPGMTRDIR
jgi:hypothetical protein